MVKFMLVPVLCVYSCQVYAQSESAAQAPASEGLKNLPKLEEPSYKKIDTQGSGFFNKPVTPTNDQPSPNFRPPVYDKEKAEARMKDKNWAVEALKERRESERLELENNEQTSLDDILEKERKAINEQTGAPTASFGELKPAVDVNWMGSNPSLADMNDLQSDDLMKARELELLSKANQEWTAGLLNPSPLDTKPAFDSYNSGSSNVSGFRQDLRTLESQLQETKNQQPTNMDFLVKSGQAPNFRKISDDPNFQPVQLSPNNSPLTSPNAVPAVPRAVNSTMSLETMRQIELQRTNAIPKPDARELNSRISDPGDLRR